MSAVENHVCTIISIGINARPEHIRPETMLRAGEIPDEQMLAIAKVIDRDFGILFPVLAYITWTTVSDIVEATERAVAARAPRSVVDQAEGEAA